MIAHLLTYGLGLGIGLSIGWSLAHRDVGKECERLRGFYVGEQIYSCAPTSHARARAHSGGGEA